MTVIFKKALLFVTDVPDQVPVALFQKATHESQWVVVSVEIRFTSWFWLVYWALELPQII
jgi:hypothetical protein